MKIAEYQQMMDYLTGPRERFNGGGSVRNKTILPKKKPEEEVKKRKIKNFEKLRSVLENPEEVKKMIDKPKRGLVDEPGSYAGYTDDEAKKIFGKLLKDKQWSKLSRQEKTNLKNEFDRRGQGIKARKPGAQTPEKLKQIADDYLKSINTALKNEDLSKITLFKEYLETNYPNEANSIAAAYRDKGVKKPTREALYNARQKLASKLVIRPKLTSQDIFKKLISGPKKSFVDIPGIDVKKLPKFKFNFNPRKGGESSKLKVQKELDKLLKSKIITNKLNNNVLPTISDVSKVLKSDATKSSTRLLNLADEIQNLNYSSVIKDKAKNYIDSSNIRQGGGEARKIYERRLRSMLNLDTALPQLRETIVGKISNIIPQLKGLINVDEVGSLTASMRRGSGPYAIFGQILGSEFNQGVKGVKIDNVKSIAQRTINSLPIDSSERLEEIKKYNAKVDAFETEANKNNPIKKVKGQKISLKPPSETIKNKKVYNQYKDLFDDHYKKYGYSFEVSADTDSIPDIAKKLDNKSFQNTVKNRFTKLIGKGGKFGALVGLGTLAGTGFALADQPGVQEAAESFPTKTEAGAGLAAATVGTKTGRSLFSKAFKGLDRFLLRPLTAIEAPTLAVPQSLYQTYKLGSDIAKNQQTDVSAADITLPTSLSSAAASKKFGLDLFANNAGFIKKFLRAGLSPRAVSLLSRGSVFATPFIETGIQGYNAYKALKEADKKADISEPRVDTALGKAPISYYNKIMSELPAVDRFGAAGGGIMKMAGKSSGPAPESGPTPQGLDFLMKRGR